MPQMSPMWWSLLFLLFLTVFMLIMAIMYTYNIYMIKKPNQSKKKAPNINWKW
uniref:ATP synthase complex subunit 8 n=1 Tax=Tuxedo susansolomonae TaxID=881772 RepID=A0A514LQI9_9HEMI|nr:ATP synthase F0 subunit 8 [Tuxedo susansolomonae]